MARRRRCSRATAATASSRCFSTSRAGRPRRRTRRNERARRRARLLAGAHRRHGAALLLPAALVLAAAARPHLLAGRADADVGFPPALPRPERRLLRSRRRHVHRRRALVGHPVSWPARLL